MVVEELIDGSMIIRHKELSLKFKEITKRVKREPERKTCEFKIRKIYVPPRDHPWRGFKINPQYSHYSQREKVAPKEKGLLLTSKQ